MDELINRNIRNLAFDVIFAAVEDYVAAPSEAGRKKIIRDLLRSWLRSLPDDPVLWVVEQLKKNPEKIAENLKKMRGQK